MKKLAIDGINGSGKTPTLELTKDLCAKEGLSVEIYAPFHLIREHIAEPDVYPLWQSNPQYAVNILLTMLDRIEEDAERRDLDVLIYDRHWATVFAQALSNPIIAKWWGELFVPTVLLSSPLSHSRRIAKRGYNAPWLTEQSLAHYTEAYDNLYSMYPQRFIGRFTVASATQDLRPIANNIVKIIDELKET